MKTLDFEKNTPPQLTESMLAEAVQARELKRQILILRIASVLCVISMAIFALFIAHDSMILSAVTVVTMLFYLIGNGIISVIYYRKGMIVKS